QRGDRRRVVVRGTGDDPRTEPTEQPPHHTAVMPRSDAREASVAEGALDLLDLVELELDRRLATEDRDERANLFLLRLDVVNDPGEVEERARGDLDAIAFGEVDLELGRLDPH